MLQILYPVNKPDIIWCCPFPVVLPETSRFDCLAAGFGHWQSSGDAPLCVEGWVQKSCWVALEVLPVHGGFKIEMHLQFTCIKAHSNNTIPIYRDIHRICMKVYTHVLIHYSQNVISPLACWCWHSNVLSCALAWGTSIIMDTYQSLGLTKWNLADLRWEEQVVEVVCRRKNASPANLECTVAN